MAKTRTAIAALMLGAAMFAAGALRPAPVGDGNDPLVPGSVEALEREVAVGKADARDHASLAMSYLERVRSDGDPAVIPRARRLLERSFEMQSEENLAASVGMASLSNVSHDFSASVEWSRRAIAIDPYSAAPYGLLGDALFELGRTRGADAAYQKMIDLRPDVGSYVRASYSAQFHGNHEAALDALRLALDAAPPVGDQRAWVYHQLGDVYSTLGRFEKSERVNRIGTQLAPGYSPPSVGIAESYISRGRFDDALPIMERAVENLPALEYSVTLGDLQWALDDRRAARETYDRAAARFAAYRASGVLPDHDFVTFYADHGYRPRAAVREARYIYDDRPTPAAADTLGWALHAIGRHEAAARFLRLALRGPSLPDATHLFHAAVIHDALGDDDVARAYARRALKADPFFSLFHLETAMRLAR